VASASALIIATDSYADTSLQQLRGPVRDADELARTLADPAIGGYAVRTVLNQPSHLIAEEIEGFFADRLREDLLLLYFSCHGLKDDAGRLYFAGTNTKLKRLAATGVAAAFVNERMDASRSRKVVLLLDCCYSGAFASGLLARAAPTVDVQERFAGRGRVVITASTAMEYAFEVSTDTAISGAGTPSLFTSAVVRGLRTGEADLDADGQVSVHELYDYVFEQVQLANSGQTPSMISHIEGDLYIATSPARPETAPAAPIRSDTPHPDLPPTRRALLSRSRVLVGAGALITATAVALILILHPKPTHPTTTGTSTPSSGSSATTLTTSGATNTTSATVSSGSVTMSDPSQGLDLVAGRLTSLLQSHLAWTVTDTLSIWDETTQGVAHLPAGTNFEAVNASQLKSLHYETGAANPPLPASQLAAGTVLAVRVDGGTVAKLQILAAPSAAGLPIRWVTYRVS
jgi:Caspase domain